MATTRIVFWTWIWSTGAGSGLLNSILEKLNWFCLPGLIRHVNMNKCVLGGKSSFKMMGLTFSPKLDLLKSNIISIAKTASNKIWALICSTKLISPETALHLYKSIIWSYMKYCCCVWPGAPSCFLELLAKLQKQICRTVLNYSNLRGTLA